MAIVVRNLEVRDAAQLARCFERCYGLSYPSDVVYDETRLGSLVELSAALFRRSRDEGFAGFVHFPTTAHEIMQRTSVRFGGVETGLMLAYLPGETDDVDVEIDARARIAVTIVYQPVAPLSMREVTLPDRYASLLGQLYELIGANRHQRAGSAPGGVSSSIETLYEQRRGLLRVLVRRIGDDLTARIAALQAEELSAPVVQVDLPLEDPGAGRAVERLAGAGFLYCGLLPEFSPGDVLRLQRLRDQPPDVLAPRLVNDGARSLLARIAEDLSAGDEG